MASSVIISSAIFVLLLISSQSQAHNSPDLVGQLKGINEVGPHLGLLVQNKSQLEAILNSSCFVPDDCDYIDIFARRFHLGWLSNRRVVIVYTGTGILNAGVCTQLLITLFVLDGIIHYGRAGNANPDYNIGDIVIAHQWAHAGLWHWQKYGSGGETGWYTKDIGYLEFDSYNVPKNSCKNTLNKVWFQYEEVFSVSGTPEVAESMFWVNISESYYAVAEKLEEITLEACMNSTSCLSEAPKVARVERGCSSSSYIDNESYRNFLYSSFNVTALDEDSVAAALVSWSNGMPFISMRSLANLAREANSESTDEVIFSYVENMNAIVVLCEFINLLVPEVLPPIPPPVEPPVPPPVVPLLTKATRFFGHDIWSFNQ